MAYTTLRLPAQDPRVESGPVQFGEDWPGVFVRGDNALFFAQACHAAAEDLAKEHWPLVAQLRGLAELLRSCSVGDTGWPPSIRLGAQQ